MRGMAHNVVPMDLRNLQTVAPTVGPTFHGPKTTWVSIIARSQLTEQGPLGFGPIQFLMDQMLSFLFVFPFLRVRSPMFNFLQIMGSWTLKYEVFFLMIKPYVYLVQDF